MKLLIRGVRPCRQNLSSLTSMANPTPNQCKAIYFPIPPPLIGDNGAFVHSYRRRTSNSDTRANTIADQLREEQVAEALLQLSGSISPKKAAQILIEMRCSSWNRDLRNGEIDKDPEPRKVREGVSRKLSYFGTRARTRSRALRFLLRARARKQSATSCSRAWYLG